MMIKYDKLEMINDKWEFTRMGKEALKILISQKFCTFLGYVISKTSLLW